MSNTAGLQEVLARRAEIAETRRSLDDEDSDLATTERVLRVLGQVFGGDAPQQFGDNKKPGRKRSGDGIPRQWAHVISLVSQNGSIERVDLLATLNVGRDKQMGMATLAALLSKMATAGHIRRIGTRVFPAKAENDGGADVSLNG